MLLNVRENELFCLSGGRFPPGCCRNGFPSPPRLPRRRSFDAPNITYFGVKCKQFPKINLPILHVSFLSALRAGSGLFVSPHVRRDAHIPVTDLSIYRDPRNAQMVASFLHFSQKFSRVAEDGDESGWESHGGSPGRLGKSREKAGNTPHGSRTGTNAELAHPIARRGTAHRSPVPAAAGKNLSRCHQKSTG